MNTKRIGDYGLIGNKRTAALVGVDGSIEWFCYPRFDSPSVFAAILDEERGGRFVLHPTSPCSSTQVYLHGTNILITTFKCETGELTLTDFMPCYEKDDRLVQLNEIHRIAFCAWGEVEVELIFEPRPDYARKTAELGRSEHGISVSGFPIFLSLPPGGDLRLGQSDARAQFRLRKGEEAVFTFRAGNDADVVPLRPGEKLEETARYWKSQAQEGSFYGQWREAILRSYLALHLLIYEPSGAIIAAPTTSLPEAIGGERNWDYRFAWLRDASLTIGAFSAMGHKDEAVGFMGWLSRVCSLRGPEGQTLYGIDRESSLDEHVLEGLSGYRGSKPVRIGNAAYRQRQLDIFGELLDAAWNYLDIRGTVSEGLWLVLQDYANAACRYWKEPDSGIWEMRSPPRHYVHSKLMCWVALNRAIRIARTLGRTQMLPVWERNESEIKQDILARGWKPEARAFTQHYDTFALDSSLLLIPVYGFLPASDSRVMSTVYRIRDELNANGLVMRYDRREVDDGVRDGEGAFLACSLWLVRALVRMDKLEEAVQLYERILACGNHVGLFSEMVDSRTGEQLGNFPLALTHLNVILAGLELDQATLWGW